MRYATASLFVVVFLAGVSVMGLEMSASRLIAPFFGSTLSVWTSLIGLILALLTVGYYAGGAIADRWPRRGVLAALVLGAGAVTCLVPYLSGWVLDRSWAATPKIGILGSSLVGTLVLFLVPVTLLGCVPPFSMRLYLTDLERTGRSAGRLYAVSALGSIVGTFIPALITIPLFGVRKSILFFGLLLIASALTLIGRSRPGRIGAGGTAALLLAVGLPTLAAHPVGLGPMMPTQGMILDRESAYNYIRVVKGGDESVPAEMRPTFMIVDNGAFSVYQPGAVLTGAYYDYLLLAPLLRPEPPARVVRRALIIGSGAGTSAKQLTAIYGPIAIDSVEIDPAIVELGREYFAMNEPNSQVHVTDGRWFVAHTPRRYDLVMLDAYQQSDIPLHLATREFFTLLREKMTGRGTLAINVAWVTPKQGEVLQALCATLRAVFPNVWYAEIGGTSGVIYAAGEGASREFLLRNARLSGSAPLLEVARQAAPRLRVARWRSPVLTDDRSPINKMVDRMYRQVMAQRAEILRGMLVRTASSTQTPPAR